MRKIFYFICLLLFLNFKIWGENSILQPQPIFPKNHISTQDFPIQEISNIMVETTFEQIELSQIYGEEISIDIYSNNNTILPKITSNINTKTLHIKSALSENPGLKSTIGDICKIIIYLPKNIQLKKFTLVSHTINNTKKTNSHIKTDGNTNKIPYLSDTIKLPEIKAENIFIETTEQNIESISGNKITANIFLKTKTGDIDINDIKASHLQATSDTGNIKINRFSGEYLLLKTQNNITANNIISDYFEIKSKTGDLILNLKKAPINTSQIKTNSGLIKLFIPKDVDLTMNVYSPKGYFFNKSQKKRIPIIHLYTKKYKNGGTTLNIESNTGNIELEEF